MRFAGYMSREEMTSAASSLDQALYVHEQWCSNLYCSLICRLPPDERDLFDNPHRRCQFGQWYYAQHDTVRGGHPGFVAIDPEHELMHRLASHMLATVQAGEPVPVRDYEGFTSAMARMRAEISGLRRELDESLTNLDPLTGATSRVGMLSKLRLQQEMVRRDLQSCVIAMMDLDHFKAVNDEYGHPAGDAVLAGTAHHVLTHMRPYDELFRYGGEEFLYWTPGTDLELGCQAVERLREGIAALSVDAGDGRTVRVTASFGVTLLDPEVPIEVSIARADRALYAAKEAGRNQLCTWDPSLD